MRLPDWLAPPVEKVGLNFVERLRIVLMGLLVTTFGIAYTDPAWVEDWMVARCLETSRGKSGLHGQGAG